MRKEPCRLGHEIRHPRGFDKSFFESFSRRDSSSVGSSFLSSFLSYDEELVVLHLFKVGAFWFFRIQENFEIHYGKFVQSYRSLAGWNSVSQHCPHLSAP